jgi:hypothetical protein
MGFAKAGYLSLPFTQNAIKKRDSRAIQLQDLKTKKRDGSDYCHPALSRRGCRSGQRHGRKE